MALIPRMPLRLVEVNDSVRVDNRARVDYSSTREVDYLSTRAIDYQAPEQWIIQAP